MLFGQREWSYLIRLACLETCLEAEEDEGPGDDVQQEGEADAEGCQEHWADRVSASVTRQSTFKVDFII